MKEIYARFPECLDGPDKGILHYALEQINHRNLFSMSIYQFSTYSYLRKMSQLPPTKELFLQFYNFVEAETWEHKRRFAPIILVEVS